MRVKTPTPEEEQWWKEWLADPERALIREAASRLDPWTLYRLKTTGQRVFLISFNDPPPGGKVTCKVGVSGEFNLISHERAVFGIDPDDLEECDLPGPDELVGSLDLPVEVVKDLFAKYPDGAPPSVMNELIYKYPLKDKRGGG